MYFRPGTKENERQERRYGCIGKNEIPIGGCNEGIAGA